MAGSQRFRRTQLNKQKAPKISVLLVDDHPPIRSGIRAMLEKTPDICIVGEAQNEAEARRLLDDLRPRIILLDLVMPGFSPAKFEKWARQTYPETITLVLTGHDRDYLLATMMEVGVAGYLDKRIRPEGLIDAIRRAVHGERLFTDAQELRAERWRRDVQEKWNNLSDLEKKILRWLATGATHKYIAAQLQINPKTFEKHLEKIYRTLGVGSGTEAAIWYSEHAEEFPY
jgi:two-component system nitrate/nitrite response regulator NarL